MSESSDNSPLQTMTALWRPGWYGLDQSLSVGQTAEFWFFREPPSDLLSSHQSVDYVFFNELFDAEKRQARVCTIESIEHPQLGPISEIMTDGLDYQFNMCDGKTLVVNAEEHPGRTNDPDLSVENWDIKVQLNSVSVPIDESSLQ